MAVFSFNPLRAALRLNIRDQGSFYVRWDMLPITTRSGSFYDPGNRSGSSYFDPGGTQHAVSVGVGTGSVPALITTGVAGLTMAVMLALLVPWD